MLKLLLYALIAYLVPGLVTWQIVIRSKKCDFIDFLIFTFAWPVVWLTVFKQKKNGGA